MSKVTDIPDALKTLERRGLMVQSLSGPQGLRYRVSLKSGMGFQISEAQLLQLHDENKLNWRGLVEIVTTSAYPLGQ